MISCQLFPYSFFSFFFVSLRSIFHFKVVSSSCKALSNTISSFWKPHINGIVVEKRGSVWEVITFAWVAQYLSVRWQLCLLIQIVSCRLIKKKERKEDSCFMSTYVKQEIFWVKYYEYLWQTLSQLGLCLYLYMELFLQLPLFKCKTERKTIQNSWTFFFFFLHQLVQLSKIRKYI